MLSLSQHLLRTDQRTKELVKRVKGLRERAVIETNLQKLREGIQKNK